MSNAMENNASENNINDQVLNDAKEYIENQAKNYENISSPFIENKSVKFNPDEYVVLKQIGWGNFSDIFLVEHKKTKELSVMKSFEINKVERMKKQRDVLMEKHVMHKVGEHNNLIKFYSSFKDDFYLYMNYEYVNGGDLWSKCIYYGLPGLNMIKQYFRQILIAIKHLHDNNIVHRDIKPENILVTKDNLTIKVIDFGSCKDMEGTKFEEEIKKKKLDAQKNNKRSRKPSFENYVGTPQYMAPECVHNKDSTKKSDSFSLGCLLYQLYLGFPPFTGKSEYLIYLKSTKGNYSIPEGLIDEEGKDLIKKLLTTCPKERLSVEEILLHKYFETFETDTENEKNDEVKFKKCTLLPFNKYDSIINKILASLYNCQIEEIENKTNNNFLILYQKYNKELEKFCSDTEIKFKVIVEKIKSDFKQAKEYSNALSELSNNARMTKDRQEEVTEDVYEKLGLVTIHLTNFETEFNYYFKNIMTIYYNEKLEEKDYLNFKLKRLSTQLEYEIFNKEFEDSENNSIPTVENNKKEDSDSCSGDENKNVTEI